MTTAYTSLLGLALPVTGELSGTWGDTVNDSITSLLDTAVAGTTNVSADSNVTLTTTTGASNQARQAILLFSGARTAIRTVTAPAQSKIYTVINATTGGFAVTLVGSGPTTGVTIANGARTVVAWNGSDFVEVSRFSDLVVYGNAGIGTSSPAAKLQISASSGGDTSGLRITRTDTGGGDWRIWSTSNANGEGGGKLIFGTASNYMTLDGSGNLGVGTTSPTHPLTIYSSAAHIAITNATTGAGASDGSRFQLSGSDLWIVNRESANLAFFTNDTERARITPTGDFLIGDSSRQESSKFQVSAAKTIGSGIPQNQILAVDTTAQAAGVGGAINFAGKYTNSGTYTSFASIEASKDNSTDSAFGASMVFKTRTDGSSQDERMRITSGGNLLVGTTNGAMYDTNAGGDVSQFYKFISTGGGGSANYGFTVSNGGSDSAMGLWGLNSASKRLRISSIKSEYTSNAAGSEAAYMSFSTIGSGALTERARITSGGDLLVGTTSAPGSPPVGPSIATGSLFANINGTISGNSSVVNIQHSGGSYFGIMLKNGSTNSSNAIVFINSSDGVVGGIGVSTTATSYSTSSDYRLKNTIAPMTGALAKVAQLKPVTYKWNANGSSGEGFIAHELAEVCPQAVSGEKDGLDTEGNPKYQGIDTSFLVATLTAAIQEQQAIIESLKARLDAANL